VSSLEKKTLLKNIGVFSFVVNSVYHKVAVLFEAGV